MSHIKHTSHFFAKEIKIVNVILQDANDYQLIIEYFILFPTTRANYKVCFGISKESFLQYQWTCKINVHQYVSYNWLPSRVIDRNVDFACLVNHVMRAYFVLWGLNHVKCHFYFIMWNVMMSMSMIWFMIDDMIHKEHEQNVT